MSLSISTCRISILIASKNSHNLFLLPSSMIITRRILRASLPFHPLLRFLNSTQTNGQPAAEAVKLIQLSKQAQRALWANYFMDTIIKSPYKANIELPSLREKLIDSPNPTLQHKYDQDIKNEMASIFTKGPFDSTAIKPIRCGLNQNLVQPFYPSVFPTQSIFQELDTMIRKLFHGSYGIGKTASIAYYIYLFNISNTYALHAARSGNEELLKEYQSLVEKQYLRNNCFKYWYWKMDWDAVQSEGFSLPKIMAEQAVELTQSQREEIRNCQTIKEAYDKIRQFYTMKRFVHIAFLDQINHAVEFVEKWNNFIANNKELIEKVLKKKPIHEKHQARIKELHQPATTFIELAMQFTAIKPADYIMNSPILMDTLLLDPDYIEDKERFSIQQEYYKKKLNQPLNFYLKGKREKRCLHMRVRSFDSQKQLLSQNGKIYFWQYFLDLLEGKIKEDKLKKEEWKQFKTVFLNYACSLKLNYNYRFMHINKFLAGYSFSNIHISSEEDRNIFIKKIIKDFEHSAFYQFQSNISKYLAQDNSCFRMKLLRAVYAYASQLQDKKQRLIIRVDKIAKMMNRTGSSKLVHQYLKSPWLNKEMIPLAKEHRQFQDIELSWTAQEFMLYSHEALFQQPLKLPLLTPDYSKYITGAKNNYAGLTIKNLLSMLLVQQNKLTFDIVKTVRNPQEKEKTYYPLKDLQHQTNSFTIGNTQKFISFQTDYSAQEEYHNIEQHFQKALEKSITTNPFYYQLASLPNKDYQEQQQGKSNREPVDFAFIERAKAIDSQAEDAKNFTIHTFKIAIGKSVKEIQQEAVRFLNKTTKSLKRKISVQHHILCIKENCLPALQVNQIATISYSDIQLLKIQVIPEREALKDLFEEMLGYVARYY